MGAAWFFGTRDFRRRWRTFFALGMVAAIAGGFILSAWAGARRTHTSVSRFTSTARSAHIVGPIASADEATWEQIATLPEVESAGRLTALAVMSQNDMDDGSFTIFGVDAEGRVGSTIERQVLLRGRRANPQASDEIALHEATAQKWDLDVGDTLELLSWVGGAWQTALATDTYEPNGPTIELKVVGVVRGQADVASSTNVPLNAVTPAFARAHPEIDTFVQLGFYRLHDGVAAGRSFTEHALARANTTPKANPEDPETTFELIDAKGTIGDALSVAESGQKAFAIIGAAATLLTMAIATVRVARHGDRQALSALGMSTRDQVAAALAPLLVTAGLALVGSVVVSYLGSRVFMPDLARRADPDPGPRFDALIVLAALAGALVILAIGMIAVARGETAATPRPTVARLPVGRAPALLAMSLARIGRRGRGGAARGAMAGVIVAMVGLAGGAIYIRNLDDLNGDRARWGLDADFTATVPDDFADRVNAAPIVDAAATLHDGFTFIDGSPVHTVATEPIVGQISPEVLKGRVPVGDDEIALSSKFFDANVHLGSTVSALDVDGNPTDMRVVGEAIAAPLDGRGSISNGAVISPEAFARLRVDQAENTTAVRMLPKANRDDTITAIGADLHDVFDIEHPAAITNLLAMRDMIVSLIALLAFLGLAGASLSFVVAIRRGRTNIAVARAMGMAHRSILTTLIGFVGGVVIAGATIAVLAGCIGGLTLWRWQSESLGVRQVTQVPWGILSAAFIIGVAAAASLGALTGDRFARTRSYEALRAE